MITRPLALAFQLVDYKMRWTSTDCPRKRAKLSAVCIASYLKLWPVMLQFQSVFLVKVRLMIGLLDCCISVLAVTDVVFCHAKGVFLLPYIQAAAAAANFSKPYVGIITDILYLDDAEPAQLQLEFKCWLLNSVTGDKVPVSICRPSCPGSYIHQKCTCTQLTR